jgi:phosphohistidine phosphatase
MRSVARGMKAMELSFDLILSSPYLRAKQTAEIVAPVFGLASRLNFSTALATGGNPQELVDELRRSHSRRRSILLVGHEPYLSRLISVLISGGTSLPITLKKGGLGKLSLDTLRYGRCATLEWLLLPRQMRRMK